MFIIAILNLIGSLDLGEHVKVGVGLPSITGLSLVAAVFLLIGVRRMRQLRSYELVRWSCCTTLIPFVSPTFPISLGIGIWCLLVLSRPEIKAAFEPGPARQ